MSQKSRVRVRTRDFFSSSKCVIVAEVERDQFASNSNLRNDWLQTEFHAHSVPSVLEILYHWLSYNNIF